MLEMIIAIAIALIIGWVMFSIVKSAGKFIINGIVGLLAMLIINAVGIGVPINILSILVVALGGLPGLAIVVILHFLHIIF
jgi:hypothetical protein